MLKTLFYSAVGLLVAAGGPVAYYSAPEYWQHVREEWFPDKDSSGAASATEESTSNGKFAAIEGAPVSNLGELLRFDIDPAWILQRWPRVSTGLSYLQLQGYRVPVVTGTKETDLAGSLTYYFNADQKLQRIAFYGTTGDPRDLIGLVTARHSFVRRLTNDPALVVYEAPQQDRNRLSVLKLTSVGTVKSSDPRRRLKVELAIERPS